METSVNKLGNRWRRLCCSMFYLMGLTLSSNVGAVISPEPNPDWTVSKDWILEQDMYVFEASSTSVVDQCKENPSHYLVFPFSQQVSQTVFVDSYVVEAYGAPDFSSLRSYFGVPEIACSMLVSGIEVKWRVYSQAKTFAKLHVYPSIESGRSWNNFFNETFNIITAGALPFLAVLCFILFLSTLPKQLSYSLVFSCVFHGIFFMSTVPEFFHIKLDALSLQKIGDTSLWIGVTLFVNCLRVSRLVPDKVFKGYLLFVIVSCVLILTSDDLDAAQLGTSIPFVASMAVLMLALFNKCAASWRQGLDRFSLSIILSLGIYVFSAFHDILTVEGYLSGYMFYSIGVLAGILFYMLYLYAQILQTYQERDYLRAHLEEEVRIKTGDLERTLAELRSAEAELVQSAKLAALGTLSAGLAHEINNAINYVHGSVSPLQKIIDKMDDAKLRAKAAPLMQAISHGTKTIVGIVKSLKLHTGQNRVEIRQIDLHAVVESVLTILTNRLQRERIEVNVAIPDDLVLFTNTTVISQVLMNLVVNALDAMAGSGKLSIRAESKENTVIIDIMDNGAGMDSATLQRIFEPFYTTKDVGKGTGLGLHIVRNELQRLGGSITLHSVLGEGTKASVTLPRGQ